MIDLALHYAKSGWPVFPLAAGAKVPAIPKERGGHGCHDASSDPTQIESWWHAYPDANVGVATGRRSGLLVVDVDPRKCNLWLESLNTLALPPTFTVKTWSGGWHLYFRFNGDKRISIGTNLLPGIDWRGNGGYVVAAGSVVNGITYQIAKNLPIAPAPATLIAKILASKRVKKVQHDSTGHMIIPETCRNDRLTSIAGSLRRVGVEFNALLECLRAINSDHCEPALNDTDLRQIAASVARYAPSGSPKESA